MYRSPFVFLVGLVAGGFFVRDLQESYKTLDYGRPYSQTMFQHSRQCVTMFNLLVRNSNCRQAPRAFLFKNTKSLDNLLSIRSCTAALEQASISRFSLASQTSILDGLS